MTIRTYVLLSSILLSVSAMSQSASVIPPIITTIVSDTDHTLFGYTIVPLGSQDTDSFDDFAIWDYRFSAYLYHGGDPPSGPPYLRIDSINAEIANLGDVDGDGYADFSAPGRSPFGWKLNIYYGGPQMDSVRDLWFGWDTLAAFGRAVVGRDVNCNWTRSLFCQALSHHSVLEFNLTGAMDSVPDRVFRPSWFAQPSFVFGESVIVTDFNGDGVDDLILNFRPSPQYNLKGEVCCYWGGCGFDSIPDLRFTQPGPFAQGGDQFGVVLEAVHDINGDGYDDIYVGHGNSSDTTNYIYFGGPALDSIPDLVIPDHTERGASAGDFNSDGQSDLMTSFSMQSSAFSYINIYYGGSNVDTTIDVRLNVSEVPGYQLEFGMGIAALGDVNNDGINDIGVAAVDNNNHGEVIIFSGTGQGTDVDIIGDPSVPDHFDLQQNYPNPFNPMTTIEFSLPSAEVVAIEIFNTLGQRVRSLVLGKLSAGDHSVTWDGTDDSGLKVASGVYFYHLSSNSSMITKKMILLK